MSQRNQVPKFNLVLIGYRAVGKTTVGSKVAPRLGRAFLDLDAVVEQEAGETIPELVARAGWPEFRRREKAVVRRYASRNGLVLATGGGVVLDQENVASLKANGKLIWLRASAAAIRARLQRDAGQTAARPGLTAKGTLDEVEAVLAAREPLYQAVADISLDVDNVSPEAVAEQIVDLVRLWEQKEP